MLFRSESANGTVPLAETAVTLARFQPHKIVTLPRDAGPGDFARLAAAI